MSSLPPILIVDDEPNDIFVLKHLLSKAGVQNKVVGFEDCDAALHHVTVELERGERLYIPCLVFTDLNMPKMSGIELLRAMRKVSQGPGIPVYILTSLVCEAKAQEAGAAGAAGFWEKFPPISSLRRIADQHCSR